MSTLFSSTIPYKQVTGSWVNGVWTTVEVDSTFTGSVQPVTGRDLEVLDVGREDVGRIKVYSNTPLNVSGEGTENSGDIVIWQGGRWEVSQAMDFQNDLISHYKYIAEFRGAAT